MKVQITRSYTDTQFNRQMSIGEVIEVTPERAEVLINRDFAISLEANEIEEDKPEKVNGRRLIKDYTIDKPEQVKSQTIKKTRAKRK